MLTDTSWALNNRDLAQAQEMGGSTAMTVLSSDFTILVQKQNNNMQLQDIKKYDLALLQWNNRLVLISAGMKVSL